MGDVERAGPKHNSTGAAGRKVHEVASSHEADRPAASHPMEVASLDGCGYHRIGHQRLASPRGRRKAHDLRGHAEFTPRAFHDRPHLMLDLIALLTRNGSPIDHKLAACGHDIVGNASLDAGDRETRLAAERMM